MHLQYINHPINKMTPFPPKKFLTPSRKYFSKIFTYPTFPSPKLEGQVWQPCQICRLIQSGGFHRALSWKLLWLNCFIGIGDQWKTSSLIYSQDHLSKILTNVNLLQATSRVLNLCRTWVKTLLNEAVQ